jgi:GNAT superfamily N-acetyltransferase
VTDDAVVRRATVDDEPAILALAQRSLGWDPGDATRAHFTWKHRENPFGESPMWVADVDGRLAGFRTFLRWELVAPGGETRRVVRAVDTATDPDFQGRGLFTRLTLAALDELDADGVDFVFNTPNEQSRPGYLKMGWSEVGRVPVEIRPTGITSVVRLAGARTPAERGALACAAGDPAAAVLADDGVTADLLATGSPPAGLATRRSAAYLRWRYGPAALHYRIVTAPAGPAAGAVVFHLRRRGPATEAVVCDAFAPADDPRALGPVLRHVARASGADYLLRVGSPTPRPPTGSFVPLPRTGPVLTARAVRLPPPTVLGAWRLTMGDVEIF